MTEKRYFKRIWEEEYYIFDSQTISENEFDEKVEYEDYQAFVDSMTGDEVVRLLNGLDGTIKDLSDDYQRLMEKNKELKIKNEELLYQIGEVGKNNKTCRECECFIPEIKYCYMWDMEVEADDIVVSCDQRKIKNTNGVDLE